MPNLTLKQRVYLPGMSTAHVMPNRFHEITFTPLVQQEQQDHGSRQQYDRLAHSENLSGSTLGISERTFIALRDSFYMATVSETGWPYIQHRGGKPGFVHVLSDTTIGFADLRGNKQYISLGNLEHDTRVALFFMDYSNQTRLKILGRVEVHEKDTEAAALIASLRSGSPREVAERAMLIHVEGYDWNCPQHITPRFTQAEIEPALAPLRDRLAALEAENAELRAKLSKS